MQKQLKALIMAVVLLVITVTGSVYPVSTIRAAEELQINIHYHRYSSH